MANLLLVDGDAQRRLDIWDRLVEEGHRVEMAALGGEALSRVLAGGICLVLLEVALADRDGLSVCEELRRRGYAGTLILLADSERTRECVLGLRAGADDVLTRPFQLVELCARIEACLRRRPVARVPAGPTLRFGDVEVDLCDARVAKAGRPVALSPREFQLLRCLIERAGSLSAASSCSTAHGERMRRRARRRWTCTSRGCAASSRPTRGGRS